MRFEVLLEEPSAAAALNLILPKIVPPPHQFSLHVFQGKPDLLKKLPNRLRGYASWMTEDHTIVILVDRDRDDCHDLKAVIEATVQTVGLNTPRGPRLDLSPQVITRIAVEELESWLLGDPAALVMAYPRLSRDTLRRIREPDAIGQNTAERLERLLKRSGYYQAGMPKVEVAESVAAHMNVEMNTSRSFCVFRDGLRNAAGVQVA